MFGKAKKIVNSNFKELSVDQQKLIIESLLKKKYRGRTLAGISSETKISTELIKENIQWNSNFANKLKVLPNRTKDGQVLITTKGRFIKDASLKEKFTDFFASNRQEIDFGN